MSKLTTATLVAAVSSAGLEVKEQSSFFKVTSPTKNRKAIYISKSKKYVTRIDLAGFEAPEHPAIKPLTKEEARGLNLGAVRGQILPKDLDMTDEDILEAFRLAVNEVSDESEGFKLGKKAAPVEEVVEEEAELLAAEA